MAFDFLEPDNAPEWDRRFQRHAIRTTAPHVTAESRAALEEEMRRVDALARWVRGEDDEE